MKAIANIDSKAKGQTKKPRSCMEFVPKDWGKQATAEAKTAMKKIRTTTYRKNSHLGGRAK